MISFSCQVCRSSLSVDDQYAGQPVRCPTCKSVANVPRRRLPPTPPPVGRGMGAGSREIVRRFGFTCPWCSSRLEATMSTAGTEGQCPTCANNIRIPILDRQGRLIDPESKKIIKPDPHPVHAYAAAGERAPKILRAANGGQTIQCARCSSLSPITANSCKSCGVPFTLEGTLQSETREGNGFATASLVLGIIGLPMCSLFVPSCLAIAFCIVALVQINRGASPTSRPTAIAGLTCGVLGLVLSIMVHL